MKRIPVPDWARPFSRLREQGFDEQEFNRCLPHHDEVMQAVQEAVQQFANDDERVFDEDFPQRARLTGEYCINNENYSLYLRPIYPPSRPEERKYILSVMVHCLEKQWIENQMDFDYLGLELFFWWEPVEQKFQYIGDIEPSVI